MLSQNARGWRHSVFHCFAQRYPQVLSDKRTISVLLTINPTLFSPFLSFARC